ncbi:STAS domain-containing protein [Geobacter sp. SVR]|uniref:STAS domain-containing protein n=1 Tax=Geobacter sp. SVR TaxID=2495594 RepID=UPI00143EFFC3|nr:STAS domain-containing protein [Geobacter sp. SVR]BCS52009.1 polyvinylalcohol dehydrogenase [Geobacter sp. SVR]GCF87177.1 polyvinylalcohol dehydrogenase [Geobacter sp. SVR]
MSRKTICQEIAAIIADNQQEIISSWYQLITDKGQIIVATMGEEEMKCFMRDGISAFAKALHAGEDFRGEAYRDARELHTRLSTILAAKGVSPAEVATLVFSKKDPINTVLQKAYPQKDKLLEAISLVNRVIDQAGLYTFETFTASREAIIKEQQKALLELSAPVVKVWERILMMPLIGIMDSARTQHIMESLLTGIEENQAKVAILDISGIPVVDSLVAKHLFRTVAAAKLMGAECIITGIRARIAQTMIQLGVDLAWVTTRNTMAEGLRVALDLTGQRFVSKEV